MKINSKTKKNLIFLVLFMVILFLAGFISSYLMNKQSIEALPDTLNITEEKYVYDNADCLSEYSEAFLETKIKTLSDDIYCKVYVVTLDSIHGESINNIAKAMKKYYETLSDNKTSLILLSSETTELALVNGEAMQDVFDENYTQDIKESLFSNTLTPDLYSDTLQKFVTAYIEDIYTNEKIINEYGKIFVSSNKDMLIVCGLCAVIFTIIAFVLLKNGKHIQKTIDIEKEQERLEFLEKKKKEDALMQENKTPSPSPSSTISPPSRSLFSDKDSFEKIWSQYQENKNTIDDAISEFIKDKQ